MSVFGPWNKFSYVIPHKLIQFFMHWIHPILILMSFFYPFWIKLSNVAMISHMVCNKCASFSKTKIFIYRINNVTFWMIFNHSRWCFFEVDTSSFREIEWWTSGGVRGLRDLNNDLVSILEFTGVDSLSDEHSSTSTPWASISTIASLELVPSTLSSFAMFVMVSSIITLMDSITIFVLLLKTLYAGWWLSTRERHLHHSLHQIFQDSPDHLVCNTYSQRLGSISLLTSSHSKFHMRYSLFLLGRILYCQCDMRCSQLLPKIFEEFACWVA